MQTPPAARPTGRTADQVSLARVAIGVLGVMPLIFVLIGALVVRQFSSEHALRADVERTHHHRAAVRELLISLEEAESAQRGFLLTGDAVHLDRYAVAKAQIEPELEAARRSSAGDTQHQRIGRAVEGLERLKLQEMDRTLELSTHGRKAASLEIIRSNEGERLMRQIGRIIDDVRADDQRKIAIAWREAERAAAWTVAWGTGLGLVALTILGGGLHLFRTAWRSQKRAHGQLGELFLRQGAVLGGAVDPIITLTPDGQVESVNPAGERAFGWSEAAMQRRDFHKFVRLERPPASGFLASIGLNAASETAALIEGQAVRADGGVFPVEVAFGAMPLESGRHVVATVRDVTERRAAERMKHEFISSVSHELRTPLTSIAGALGLLRSKMVALPAAAERLVEIAHSNSERLNRLVDDILDLDKLQSEPAPFAQVRFDLRSVFRDAAAELEGYLHEAGVVIEIDAEMTPVWAIGDAARIAQVATNLLSNAAKFSPAGERVRIAFSRRGEIVQVRVQNHGSPIPAEFHARIFSRFAQADGSDTRTHGGTGLGLAICKEIVERHAGKIFFKSDAQEGTRFYLHLPAAAETHLVAAAPPAPSVVAPPRLRVLICEDDPQVGELLQAVVKAEGAEPELVCALKQAAIALGQGDYDVALLDLHLPDGDSLAFLRASPQAADGERMPVIIVSAEPPRALDPQLYPVAILDWLEKPIRPGALRTSIRAAFKRVEAARAVARPVILHIDDDPDVARLVRDRLEPMGEVVGAESLADAKQKLAVLEPDLVVLDLGLADGSGLTLLPFLIDAQGARIPTIVFSAQVADPALADVDVVLAKTRGSIETLAAHARRLIGAAAASADAARRAA